jgi:hypothetical protein
MSRNQVSIDQESGKIGESVIKLLSRTEVVTGEEVSGGYRVVIRCYQAVINRYQTVIKTPRAGVSDNG